MCNKLWIIDSDIPINLESEVFEVILIYPVVSVMSNNESDAAAEWATEDHMAWDAYLKIRLNTTEEPKRNNSEELQYGDESEENNLEINIEEVIIKAEFCKEEYNESLDGQDLSDTGGN